MNRTLAASLVHLYTASGTFLAFWAVLLITEQQFQGAFMLLMISMFVDYSDGTLARIVRIRQAMPIIDGASLDHIVDFATSAFVPGILLWQADLLPRPRALWIIIIFSATLYKFCKVHNPWLSQGFFTGLPTPWITLSFYAFHYPIGQSYMSLIIILLSLLTFLPLKFIHIARCRHWRKINILALASWWVIYIGVIQGWMDGFWLNISLLYPLFYILASWYLGERYAKASDSPERSGSST